MQKDIGGVGVLEVEGREARERSEKTDGGREVDAEGKIKMRETGQACKEV